MGTKRKAVISLLQSGCLTVTLQTGTGQPATNASCKEAKVPFKSSRSLNLYANYALKKKYLQFVIQKEKQKKTTAQIKCTTLKKENLFKACWAD